MKVGDNVRVRMPNEDTLPSVAALAGREGVIVSKRKYIGAPLVVDLDDGSRWNCWPDELERA